jgi:hypothetical protein
MRTSTLITGTPPVWWTPTRRACPTGAWALPLKDRLATNNPALGTSAGSHGLLRRTARRLGWRRRCGIHRTRTGLRRNHSSLWNKRLLRRGSCRRVSRWSGRSRWSRMRCRGARCRRYRRFSGRQLRCCHRVRVCRRGDDHRRRRYRFFRNRWSRWSDMLVQRRRYHNRFFFFRLLRRRYNRGRCDLGNNRWNNHCRFFWYRGRRLK